MRQLHSTVCRSLVAVATVATLAAGCGTKSEALPPEEAAALLENRNWLDHWPTDQNEKLHVYRFTPSMGGGVYQDRTLFRGTFELFTYELSGEQLRIRWPHEDRSERLRYTIEAVKGPHPFDLKLTFDDNSTGPSVLYGRRSETAASWPTAADLRALEAR